MSVVSTVDYRIVGDEEVLEGIYEKCQQIIDSNDRPSLALLLDTLNISYSYMPSSTIYSSEYSDGVLKITTDENCKGPSDFRHLLCDNYEDLSVYFWVDIEDYGFFTNDEESIARNVELGEVMTNDETLDYVNDILKESESLKDSQFDTFEDFQEWYEAHEDEAIDEGIELQIAEVSEDFED